MDKSREADAIVGSLSQAMASGETGLRYVPALLLRVINEDMWRERVVAKTGQVAQFDTFLEFVITEPLEGLGADLPTLKRLCADNPAARNALDEVLKNEPYAKVNQDVDVNNVNVRPVGNSADYALRKLRADAPKVHTRVIAGELTPHAGMVEAGFRKKNMQIPSDPAGAARALIRKFNADELQQLIEIIAEQIATS